jgi:hypothetical protein
MSRTLPFTTVLLSLIPLRAAPPALSAERTAIDDLPAEAVVTFVRFDRDIVLALAARRQPCG